MLLFIIWLMLTKIGLDRLGYTTWWTLSLLTVTLLSDGATFGALGVQLGVALSISLHKAHIAEKSCRLRRNDET